MDLNLRRRTQYNLISSKHTSAQSVYQLDGSFTLVDKAGTTMTPRLTFSKDVLRTRVTNINDIKL